MQNCRSKTRTHTTGTTARASLRRCSVLDMSDVWSVSVHKQISAQCPPTPAKVVRPKPL